LVLEGEPLDSSSILDILVVIFLVLNFEVLPSLERGIEAYPPTLLLLYLLL
jgi:hypothetical protein